MSIFGQMKRSGIRLYAIFCTLLFLPAWTPLKAQVIAIDDLVVMPEDSTVYIRVQDNDINLGAAPLFTFLFDSPAHGAISLINQDSIYYVPDLNYNGIDTFTYGIVNSDEIPSYDYAQVIISLIPVPDYPVAVNDTATTDAEIPVTVNVQQNDTNFDAEILQTAIVDPPLHGMAVLTGDSSVTYTPAVGFYGEDTILYSVCKTGSAVYCDSAFIFLHVLSTNGGPPVAVNDVVETTPGTAVTIDVLANDSDPDGDMLHIGALIINGDMKGTASLNADSTIVLYSADSKTTDIFYYVACDDAVPMLCDTAQIKVEVRDLHVPNAFSPNGDGINDYLVIDGLDAYPVFDLKIFNRWGDLVFENEDPDIQWDGTANQNFIAPAGKVDNGTYFYILDLGPDTSALKGYIVLKR